MTHDCPYCGDFVSGYHSCSDGEDRVAYECIDCHEEQDRDTHHFEIEGVAPKRCAQCTFARMEAGL